MEQGLSTRNLLGIQELSAEDIRLLLATAVAFSSRAGEIPPLLMGQSIATLFFEPSTRTRMSFDVAIRRLGGQSLSFTSAQSSVEKGESLLDTARNIQALSAQALVVRSGSAGIPHFLSRHLSCPILNAGDGFHEHPTQALLDCFTIEQKLGSVAGKLVLILGDIAHSRVARSNIHLLKKLGAQVVVCGPPTLLPPSPESMGVRAALRPEDVLPEVDVVMALRVQLERQSANFQVPSLQEYARFWSLDRTRARLLKPTAIILHPGPINRGVEIDPEVVDSHQSLVLHQVTNGIFVRMAALAALCNPDGFKRWWSKRHV